MEQTGVVVNLIGENGNVFYIMGKVITELKRAGLSEVADEYRRTILQCESYDEALRVTLEVVEAV